MTKTNHEFKGKGCERLVYDHIAKALEFGTCFFHLLCARKHVEVRWQNAGADSPFAAWLPGSNSGRVSQLLYPLSRLAAQELEVKCLKFSLGVGIQVIFITLLHIFSNNYLSGKAKEIKSGRCYKQARLGVNKWVRFLCSKPLEPKWE